MVAVDVFMGSFPQSLHTGEDWPQEACGFGKRQPHPLCHYDLLDSSRCGHQAGVGRKAGTCEP